MYGIFAYIWLIFMVNVGKYNYTSPMDAMGPYSQISWKISVLEMAEIGIPLTYLSQIAFFFPDILSQVGSVEHDLGF